MPYEVAGQSTAQVRYVDEQGVTHWVQSADMVPEQYRAKAATPQLPAVRLKGTQGPAEYTGSSSPRTPRSTSASYSRRVNRAVRTCEGLPAFTSLTVARHTWPVNGLVWIHVGCTTATAGVVL